MTDKEEKRDETPTRMKHANGGHVRVPAYKVPRLLRSGAFSKVSGRRAAAPSGK